MALFKRTNSPNWWTEFESGGRRVVRSTRTASRREAEGVERALRDQVAAELREQRKSPTTGASITLDAACGRYWKDHGRKLADARNVARWLRYIVSHLNKEMPIRDLSTKHVADMVSALLDEDVGRISINRTVTCLQGVHNMAAKRWEEPVKVIDWKLHKTKERGRSRAETQEACQRLLDNLPPHIRAVVLFILTTGLRRNEAFRLVWGGVDLDAGTARVKVKGSKWREVQMTPEATEVVKAQAREGRYVFDTTNYRKHFEKAREAAGIEDFRWHDLRHTFATWLGRSGAPLDVIRDQLGHSSISVTQKYRHVAQHELKAALQKFPTVNPNSREA